MKGTGTFIGRCALGSLFLVFGAMGALNIPATAAYLGKLDFPRPQLMAYLSVAVEIAGAIALLIGWKARWFAALLILYVLIATGAAHRFWEYGSAERVAQMQHFFKNLAIIGGLLYVVLYGPGPVSADKR